MGTDHPCHNIFILIKSKGAIAAHDKTPIQISTKSTITNTRHSLSIKYEEPVRRHRYEDTLFSFPILSLKMLLFSEPKNALPTVFRYFYFIFIPEFRDKCH